MNEENIKPLLVSILRTIADATIGMDSEDMDCGKCYYPELKYMPVFEFSNEDLQTIKNLGKEELEDFSTLTNF